ncbi:MAG: hypothetical protein JNM85_09970 [Chthonomonas sp.]|nr:hypothetical protein [Chthonomonas sp.]
MHHGDIAIAETKGTELANFSDKPRRPVVVAYLLADVAFVYPITSKPGRNDKSAAEYTLDGTRAYVITSGGLISVPLGALTSTGAPMPGFSRLRDRIERHLAERELQSMGSKELQHRPLSSLEGLRAKLAPVSEPKPSAIKKPTPDPWHEYLDKHLDEDMKWGGYDGRSKKER